MNLGRLVLAEILYRRLNFVLSVVSIAIAVACVLGAETLLRVDRVATAEILGREQLEIEQRMAQRRAAVQQAGLELQDVMRKSMKGLGFNVLILPAEQNPAELHLDGSLSATMPESYVDRLAQSDIVTVNHLLPSVNRRIHWEEEDLDVVLVGTRGEVPIMHRGLKKPILDAIAPGKMAVGHAIHHGLEWKVGDRVKLRGREFTLSALHPERGSIDDVTIWIDLGQAQEMLGLENLVHAILALECDCAGDRISQIRSEIGQILPGTQVIERYSQALARAEARSAAQQTAEDALDEEIAAGKQALADQAEGRAALERQHEQFAQVLVPLVVLAAAAWVGLLAYTNARQRSSEIGILRAIGLRSWQILTVFLSKAGLVGIAGALVGALAGLAFAISIAPRSASTTSNTLAEVFPLLYLGFALCAAPLLTVVASWLPAVLLARQDPATVLQRD